MSHELGGFQPWLMQRLTAVYLALYVVFFLLLLLIWDWDFPAWRELMTHPWMVFANLLFFVSLLLHAWVGIRDVVVDYVHPLLLRLFILIFIAAALLYFGFWALQILLMVSTA
jgi:succinate dehydrogenase / fumarate reductase membrane anchor subunit